MFAIYGTSGQIFHGPFEELRRVAPTLPSLRVRPVEPAFERLLVAAPDREPARPVPTSRALNAYADAQKSTPERQQLKIVSDVMTREPVVVPDHLSVWEALQHLASHRVGQGPVVDARNQLVGLLTWVQLMQPDRLPDPGADPQRWREQMRQPVTQWMVSPVPSVEPDTDIRRLAWVLLETGLPGLPVVVANGLVSGFVSRADILRAVTHDPPLDLWAL